MIYVGTAMSTSSTTLTAFRRLNARLEGTTMTSTATEVSTPTTQAEWLTDRLRHQEHLTHRAYSLYPAGWSDTLWDAWNGIVDRIVTEGPEYQRNGTWNTYPHVDTYLLTLLPTGNPLRPVIEFYPEVISRWLYPAVAEMAQTGLPVTAPDTAAPEDDEAAEPAPLTVRERFPIGSRARIITDNTTSSRYRVGDIVEIVDGPWDGGDNAYARTAQVESSTEDRPGHLWNIYVRDLQPLSEAQATPPPRLRRVNREELRAGMVLTVTSNESGDSFPVGSTVTVSDPLHLDSGVQRPWVYVDGIRDDGSRQTRSAWYISDFSVPVDDVEFLTAQVADLTAEVERLRTIVAAVQSAVAPF